jgi:SOS-response transcriptional repressor LexA
MEPDYCNGDIVLMDAHIEPRKGSVVAAIIDNTDSTLKKYSRRDDDVTLTPMNTEKYEPMVYHAKRLDIRGVLVEIIQRAAR